MTGPVWVHPTIIVTHRVQYESTNHANLEPATGKIMGTIHHILERPLTIHPPLAMPIPRIGAVGARTVRLILGTAMVAMIAGACLGFIVGYAAAAGQIGP